MDRLQDIKSVKFWQHGLSEFVGTLLLLLVCSGVAADFSKDAGSPDLVKIGLVSGLAVAAIVWMFTHVSGGHINPAVTIGFFVTRKMSFVSTLLYAVMQSVGSICGSGIVYLLSPAGTNDMVGNIQPGDGVSDAQTFVAEALITFILLLVVFGVFDPRRPALVPIAPLAIGLTVAMNIMWAGPYSGSAMNPVRALGSAVVSGYIREHPRTHSMYWWGPLLGGILGALLYDLVFAVNASVDKAKAFFFRGDYDDSQFEAGGAGLEYKPLTSVDEINEIIEYSRLE